LAIGAEQVFDPLPESLVTSARPFEERSPFGRFLDVESGKENAFGIFGRVRHRRDLLQKTVRNPVFVFAETDGTKI
jgi:hypothetical protein